METKQRIGNEGTDRARFQVRFCSHFSLSRSVPVLLTSVSTRFQQAFFFSFLNCTSFDSFTSSHSGSYSPSQITTEKVILSAV